VCTRLPAPTQKTLPGGIPDPLYTALRAGLPPYGGFYFSQKNQRMGIDFMADKTKRIDIRVSEKELLQIDKQAEKAQMNRSEFLIKSALEKQITVFDGGKEIVYQLSKIGSNINQLKILAHQDKIKIVYLDKFAEEVSTVWRLLSSSTSQTEPTPE